jgi:hypothetical protein
LVNTWDKKINVKIEKHEAVVIIGDFQKGTF